MKVLLLNGSPHEHGCTDAALREVADTLREEGIEAEIFWIRNEPVGGCNVTAFLDRLFYSAPKAAFCRKPAAVVTSARRAGTTAAYEQLLKYPGISEMPIVSSCYWNNVHGSCPEDVQKDEEGLRTMRVLGRNMAWMLRCIAAGKAAGVPDPKQEPMLRTNFIR